VKFKLDENLGQSVVTAFETKGHDVSSVHLQGMEGANDKTVFEVCAAEARTLVTLDLDFANPLTFDPRGSAGVAVLRLPKDAGPSDLRSAIEVLLESLEQNTITGELWVLRSGRVRKWVPRSDLESESE
jgi:predicted nuclease of predicted toxin-antitoxin system